jgi:hypothetical protein
LGSFTDDYGAVSITYLQEIYTTALVVISSTKLLERFTYNVTGLSPSTSYYFRIFASVDNFSAQDGLLQLMLLHRQDQLTSSLYQTLLVTQKYLQIGMQQQEQPWGMSCIVLLD